MRTFFAVVVFVVLALVGGVSGAVMGAWGKSYKATGFNKAVDNGFWLGVCAGGVPGFFLARVIRRRSSVDNNEK